MRRFDENVVRISDRQQRSVTQAAHEIRCDVVVRTGEETEPHLRMIEVPLQVMNRDSNLGPRIIIKAGQYVRCAGYALYSLCYIRAGHVERNRKFVRPVVHARQYMAMQIDHRAASTRV